MQKKTIFAPLSICVITGVSLFLGSIWGNYLENSYHDETISKALVELQTQQNHLLETVKALDESRTFDEAIKTADLDNLKSNIAQAKDDYDIDKVMISDSKGIVLSTESETPRGTHILQTTDWGKELLKEKKEVATVSKTFEDDLAIISGKTITNKDEVIGSIITGLFVNDNYSQDFKSRHLENAHIAFYDQNKGIVADSFEDPFTKDILYFYFNSGSDAYKTTDYKNRLRIEGVDYKVKNVPFSGLSEGAGGTLVFLPSHHRLQAGLIGLSGTSAFLIAFLYFVFKFGKRPLKNKKTKNRIKRAKQIKLFTYANKQLILFGCITGPFIFVVSFLTSNIVLNQDLIKLGEPGHTIYNSTMELQPSHSILTVGETYATSIKLIPGGEPINGADISLSFDPQYLSVTDINFRESFCNESLVLDRVIDNTNGLVKISCITPTPDFNANILTVADVDFKALKKGQAEFNFNDKSSVYAHDGLGTDVLRYSVGASYTTVTKDDLNDPEQIILYSSNHPNQVQWYAENTIELGFINENENKTYQMSLNKLGTTAAQVATQNSTSDILSYQTLADGQYEFQISRPSNPSISTTYKVNIDSTPPLPADINASSSLVSVGELINFSFNSSDAMSGLQRRFYVKINDGILFPVDKNYITSFDEPGDYKLTVRSFDLANNYSDSSIDIQVLDI